MMTLEMIMSTDLITIAPDDNLATARQLMNENRIHHLPVMDNDELVGLVTLTDVLAATDSFLRDPDNRIHAREIVAKDIMVTDVATVDEHASLRQAALFLEKHRIGCLPVVTKGELKGIITDTDFVGVAINLLEQLEMEEFEDFDEDLDVDLDEVG
ncbi:MAG: CBS domain-containing protein [Gammaproteobacteria bacterium]|nr:CBS domain-containing protein [Gammaproteobacteria bacterium]MDH5345696.1 CBS domain-containing protein [Gammaproteobacteria bacterium]